MDVDKLWKLLDSVQSQIRVFDTKAQLVIAIGGLLAGFFGTQTGKMAELIGQRPGSLWSILLTAAGVTCVCLVLCSLLLAVSTVHPRLSLGQPNSRLFFMHIAGEFKENYSHAADVLTALTPEQLSRDLSNQILANSVICCTKAKRFKHALFTLSVAVIVWVFVLFIQFADQEELGVINPTPRSIPALTPNAPATVQNYHYYYCAPEQSRRERATHSPPEK